ncbi:uncharacterized protein [Clytia hemisphaerica]|uniref:uncharacterized protein isoform X2 n=1 Tax=Clytia hemisphaerica TaxID=252671 RepID=UPI0034D51733
MMNLSILTVADDESEQPDETKSIDYIKRNYGGISSHFQFEEEKEWRDEKSASENVLNLDLTQLSNEIINMQPTVKLQLHDTDSRLGYCVRNLSELASVDSKAASTASNFNTNGASVSPTLPNRYQWSYKGIEQYQPEFMTSYVTSGFSSSADLNSNKEQMFVDSTNTGFFTDDNNGLNKNIDSSYSHKSFQTNETLDNEDKDTERDNKLTATESVKNENTITGKDDTCVGDGDDDIDKLLELPTSPPGQSVSDQSKPSENDKKLTEENAQELDDWLDTII